MVLTGSLSSSRNVAIRLIRLTPKRCRPTATPSSANRGTRRRSHVGHVLASRTCCNCSELRGNEELAAFDERIEAPCPPSSKEGCQGHLALRAPW